MNAAIAPPPPNVQYPCFGGGAWISHWDAKGARYAIFWRCGHAACDLRAHRAKGHPNLKSAPTLAWIEGHYTCPCAACR